MKNNTFFDINELTESYIANVIPVSTSSEAI